MIKREPDADVHTPDKNILPSVSWASDDDVELPSQWHHLLPTPDGWTRESMNAEIHLMEVARDKQLEEVEKTHRSVDLKHEKQEKISEIHEFHRHDVEDFSASGVPLIGLAARERRFKETLRFEKNKLTRTDVSSYGVELHDTVTVDYAKQILNLYNSCLYEELVLFVPGTCFYNRAVRESDLQAQLEKLRTHVKKERELHAHFLKTGVICHNHEDMSLHIRLGDEAYHAHIESLHNGLNSPSAA